MVVTTTYEAYGREFTTKVAGVSFQNADGTDRQQLVRQCRVGDQVTLVREPHNPHGEGNAIAVFNSKNQQLGYIPSGDPRLANHIDRGGKVSAEILKVTGGPTLLQRIFRLRGRYYGCVLKVTEHSFDWEAVKPWMDANGMIDQLIKEARRVEKEDPDAAIVKYRGAIDHIRRLDSEGRTASAWRTVKYPINRLSLTLERQRRYADALAEIRRWEQYDDPCGITSNHQLIEKLDNQLRSLPQEFLVVIVLVCLRRERHQIRA